MYSAIVIILVILFLWIGLPHGVEKLENRLLYQPVVATDDSGYSVTPEDYGLAYEVLDIDHLYGWFIKPIEMTNKTRILVYCHGNGGNITNTLAFADLMTGRGFAVVTFDYSGYGRSTGTPSEENLVRDTVCVITALLNKGYPPERIIVYGHSLGGAVAISAVAEHPWGHKLAGLVVEGTFCNLRDRARDSFSWLQYFNFPLRNKYSSDQTIKHVRCPILVAHSQQDEVIRYEHAEKLYSRLAENYSKARMITIKGSHNNPIYTPEFFKTLESL